MSVDTLSSFTVADTEIRYLIDRASGRVGWQLIPRTKAGEVVEPRAELTGMPYVGHIPGASNPPARRLEPLVHVKFAGTPYDGSGAFAQGLTLCATPDATGFAFHEQHTQGDPEDDATGRKRVVTLLKNAKGHELHHRLAWHEGDGAVEIECAFHNGSQEPVTLELLTSFALGGLTPFAADDASGRLRVHRFRSAWCAEGRLDTRTLDELHLEPSWNLSAQFGERFGQVGTLPVRKWFPFVALEDTGAGVVWAAQLCWAGSWQMEIRRQRDDAVLSGGLADREFGHWTKTVAPGETLTAPPARLACVAGDLDAACERLTVLQKRATDSHPSIERDLPILFNEYCTSWGHPSHDRIVSLARRLRGSETRVFVIDGGWYREDKTCDHGEWTPSARRFPYGLDATLSEIRENGFIPGIWFEFETVGVNSIAFSLADHFLERDNEPITVRGRRFWDMNDPAVIARLTAAVIDFLERHDFGYLKIDYNETLGIGCENTAATAGTPDARSLGEGLRRQVLGVYRFLDTLRERLPGLIIENCASGGHRLEPSLLGRTAMSSFSDAHYTPEISIIAASLHRLMLPRQSQIWAVLREEETETRLVYSLAATFLGRMCLSGDIDRLSDGQWGVVLRAQQLYRRVVPIIREGSSRFHGELGPSWRHPRGWQAVTRSRQGDGKEILVVAHAFADSPKRVHLPLPARPGSTWKIAEELAPSLATPASIEDGVLHIHFGGDFTARVLHLT